MNSNPAFLFKTNDAREYAMQYLGLRPVQLRCFRNLRRQNLTIFLIVALALSACLPASQSASPQSGFTPIALDEFPNELGSGFPVADSVEEGSAEVGDPAPNFAFFLEDGRGADLASLQGKPVVLNFWATWCGPCRAEMPALVALHERNPHVIVLEINVQEERAAIEDFAAEFGMTMPVVVDQAGAIRRAYRVRNMPTTVFIKVDGAIAARWPGILIGEQLTEFVDQISTQ